MYNMVITPRDYNLQITYAGMFCQHLGSPQNVKCANLSNILTVNICLWLWPRRKSLWNNELHK